MNRQWKFQCKIYGGNVFQNPLHEIKIINILHNILCLAQSQYLRFYFSSVFTLKHPLTTKKSTPPNGKGVSMA